jgi:hypothetical protein
MGEDGHVVSNSWESHRVDYTDVGTVLGQANLASIDLIVSAQACEESWRGRHRTLTLLRRLERPGTAIESQNVISWKRALEAGAERLPSCVMVTMTQVEVGRQVES